jgi:CubicO group peptidase (beta-lactamase class C family)
VRTLTWALSAALTLTIAQPAAAVAPSVAAHAAQYQKASGSPGLVIAIVRRHGAPGMAGYGVMDQQTRRPVTSRSVFHMASVTKPFVATAILQLVEQGKIELDAPVTRYLPYFRLADPRFSQITIRQMLNHTSGMPDVEDYEWDKPQYDEAALEAYVRTLKDAQLVSAPGAEWHYSNIAYDTLGDVIAKVSGQPFETYVADEILKSVGMTHSSLLVRDIPAATLMTPYSPSEAGPPVKSAVFPYNRIHAGSSTLYSNAEDMAKWAGAVLHGDAGVLRPESFAEITRAYDVTIKHPTLQPYDPHIALGWFRLKVDGQYVIWHQGQDVGFTTNLIVAPEAGVAVLAMSNIATEQSSEQLFEMCREILREAIASPPASSLAR